MRRGDRAIRWTTTLSVVVLAGIAALLSYRHMYVLVRRYGETSWTATLLPVSVDGMIAASSMTLLADSRHGQRSGLLPWALLVIGSMASLAANVAVAEPSAAGRLIAIWPSCALIGSYELLMRQVRHSGAQRAAIASHPPYATPATNEDHSSVSFQEVGEDADPSYVPHMDQRSGDVASYGVHTALGNRPRAAYDAQTGSADGLTSSADDFHSGELDQVDQSCSRQGRPVSELQLRAWQWAVANRTPTGDLPSGKAIAEHFGRRERWGRLVKQAGATAGYLGPSRESPPVDRNVSSPRLHVDDHEIPQ